MTTGYWDLPGSLYTGCFWFDAAFSSSLFFFFFKKKRKRLFIFFFLVMVVCGDEPAMLEQKIGMPGNKMLISCLRIGVLVPLLRSR